MFHKRSSAINLIYSGQQLFSYTAVIYNNELEQKKFYNIDHSSDNGAARSLGKIEVGHFFFFWLHEFWSKNIWPTDTWPTMFYLNICGLIIWSTVYWLHEFSLCDDELPLGEMFFDQKTWTSFCDFQICH